METGCIPSSLDIFSLPPHEVGIDEISIGKHLPISGVTNDTAIEFHIPGESSQYLDLNYLRLYLQVQVVRADDKPLDDTMSLSLAPLFPHGLFRQIDVTLGQKSISTSTNTYPYRAYFEKALSYSRNVKNEILNDVE